MRCQQFVQLAILSGIRQIVPRIPVRGDRLLLHVYQINHQAGGSGGGSGITSVVGATERKSPLGQPATDSPYGLATSTRGEWFSQIHDAQ